MPIMFDPSRYVPDMSGMALQGNKLAVESAMGATQNSRENLQLMAELQQRRTRAAQELMIARAQMAEREAARKALGQRFDQRIGLQRQQMANQQSDLMYERGQKQQATDADLVAGLVGPLSSGNLNAMDAARAQALARDPSLSIQLPGEKGPDVEPVAGIPSADDVYPEQVHSLRVSRGGKNIYTSQDANDARRREAEIAGRMVGPMSSSPWADVAVGLAGAGLTGEKAGEIARSENDKQLGRESAERAVGMREGQANRRFEQDDQKTLTAHAMKIVASQGKGVDRLSKADDELALAEQQLMSGNEVEQIKATQGVRKAYTGLASTASERKEDAEAIGKLNQLEAASRTWLGTGGLTDEYRAQLLQMVQHARESVKARRQGLGRQARDHFYASPGLPALSPRQKAEFGAQVYTGVTGEKVAPEVLDAEERRLSGGRGAAAVPRGAAPPPGDQLPVTGKPQPIPTQAPDGGDDTGLDDMLKRMEENYAP